MDEYNELSIKQKSELLDKLVIHAETIENGICLELNAVTNRIIKLEVEHMALKFLNTIKTELNDNKQK